VDGRDGADLQHRGGVYNHGAEGTMKHPRRYGIKLGIKISLKFKIEWESFRELDMTQEAFARRIGIGQNYLSTWEHGNVQIGSEILLKMSREFGKTMERLLT
jgi:DNA-binding XRE family transcriptional regulator